MFSGEGRFAYGASLGCCFDGFVYVLGDRFVEHSVGVDDHVAGVGEIAVLSVKVQDVDGWFHVGSVEVAGADLAVEAFTLECTEIPAHVLAHDVVRVAQVREWGAGVDALRGFYVASGHVPDLMSVGVPDERVATVFLDVVPVGLVVEGEADIVSGVLTELADPARREAAGDELCREVIVVRDGRRVRDDVDVQHGMAPLR